MAVIALERNSALVNDGNLTTQRGYEFLEELTDLANQNETAQGTGSPEGVLTALPGKQYMDLTGISGMVLYVKQTGSGNTGWVLV